MRCEPRLRSWAGHGIVSRLVYESSSADDCLGCFPFVSLSDDVLYRHSLTRFIIKAAAAIDPGMHVDWNSKLDHETGRWNLYVRAFVRYHHWGGLSFGYLTSQLEDPYASHVHGDFPIHVGHFCCGLNFFTHFLRNVVGSSTG